MAPHNSRPRSNTSASTTSNQPRPLSRTSTTSLNTTFDYPPKDTQSSYQLIFPHNQTSSNYGSTIFTPEEMISRSETQLKNPDQSFINDPNPRGMLPHPRATSVDTAYSGNLDSTRPSLGHSKSYDSQQNNVFSSVDDEKPQSTGSKTDTQKRSKGSASSQANDQELRRLFRENSHRDLRDVAASVLANERGPKSEKTKQIFAMNWLSLVCKRSTTSVPRNRVYAQYAQRCGTERVPLLNPASFGKLVRIIFPDITTRRLGMRGESKYHYVDLALETDEPDRSGSNGFHFPPRQGGSGTEPPAFRHHTRTDTADFPSPNLPPPVELPKPIYPPRIESRGHLFLDRTAPDLHKGHSRENMISRTLKFPSSGDEAFLDDAPVDLPDLDRHLPPGTDPDTSATLKALYRSHCVSIIDCVRFCKEKSFWHHFTSFHGTLTVPVQKLFAHPNVAPWIRECDWLMYQKMIQFVSPLALQVMPEMVTNAFQSIADNLGRLILSVFNSHPQHVRDAKHGPAVVFTGLLSRLLRVNAASHAAAHILGNDITRDQMWHDWVHFVKPTVVAESCLPGAGYSRCIQILTSGLRELLSPLSMTSYPDMQQLFFSNTTDDELNFPACKPLDDSSTTSVLDRWVIFLNDLPSRFPQADARTLLYCVSDVGTAALRDITMATAVSFGQWTVTKVWVDEMMQWLAEKGGFLECPPDSAYMRPKKRSADEAGFSNSLQNLNARPQPVISEIVTAHTRATSDSFNLDRQSSQPNTHRQPPHEAPSFHVLPNAPGLNGQDLMTDALYSHAAPSCVPAPANTPPMTQKITQSTNKDQSRASPQHGTTKSRQSQPIHLERTMYDRLTKEGVSSQSLQMPKGISLDESHDDSGIGLELDPPPEQNSVRLADYGGFIATTNSDPADVVVC